MVDPIDNRPIEGAEATEEVVSPRETAVDNLMHLGGLSAPVEAETPEVKEPSVSENVEPETAPVVEQDLSTASGVDVDRMGAHMAAVRENAAGRVVELAANAGKLVRAA